MVVVAALQEPDKKRKEKKQACLFCVCTARTSSADAPSSLCKWSHGVVTFEPRCGIRPARSERWTRLLWLSWLWGWRSQHVKHADLSYSSRPLVKGSGRHL